MLVLLIGGIYGLSERPAETELLLLPEARNGGASQRQERGVGILLHTVRQAGAPQAAGEGRAALDVVAFALPDVQGATVEAAGEPEPSADLGGQRVSPGTVAVGLPSVTAPNSIEGQFFDGYRDAGGRDEDRIAMMIWCESSWTIDPGGWHLGLAQFDPGTWATVSGITGYTDPYNPYHQGFNVAVWASMVRPGTSAGWPHCFHAIDW